MALALVGSITLAMPRLSEFLAEDACLDQHGSYDETKGECDYVNSHPYIPGTPRRPLPAPSVAGKLLVVGGGILLLGGAVFLVRGRSRAVEKS